MASRRYKVKKTAQGAQNEAAKDLIENPDALVEQFSKTEEFVQKNKNLVLGALTAVLLVVGGILGYRYYIQGQDSIAQNDIWQGQFYFEQDSLDKTLNGDGAHYGMNQIVEDYAGTKSANLAKFYAGVSLLKKGEYANSIEQLKDFSSSDLLLQARAYSNIGDAYMELGNYHDAANYYDQAADYKPNEFFTPQYLMKAALAFEKQNDNTSAIARYQEIIDKYFGAGEYQEARKHKARLELLASP